MKLYSYYQSSASYRVRIALNLKGIAVEMAYVDLTKAAHRTDEYRAVNPQMLLPSLVLDDGRVLTQSMAIMEYLDETQTGAPLLPADPVARAQARAIANAIAGDIAPVNNLKIRKKLADEYGMSADQIKQQWIQHWIVEGFKGLEAELARNPLTGKFCVGDTPTIADCCLIPQIFNARRFECDLAPFPTIRRIVEACEAHPAFIAAHPSQQGDAPKAA